MFEYRRFLHSVVFNNPFNSFHDTVAEAKQEREQLDRLLTISTPRERLLVVGIALLLCMLGAWLLLGGVARSLAVDGVLVEPQGQLSEVGESVQALVWVEAEAAGQIQAGMRAVVELATTGGATHALAGEVTAIAAVPASEGLVAFESVAPLLARRVDIALDEGLDFAVLGGGECRLVVELGGQSPLALFGNRRP